MYSVSKSHELRTVSDKPWTWYLSLAAGEECLLCLFVKERCLCDMWACCIETCCGGCAGHLYHSLRILRILCSHKELYWFTHLVVTSRCPVCCAQTVEWVVVCKFIFLASYATFKYLLSHHMLPQNELQPETTTSCWIWENGVLIFLRRHCSLTWICFHEQVGVGIRTVPLFFGSPLVFPNRVRGVRFLSGFPFLCGQGF